VITPTAIFGEGGAHIRRGAVAVVGHGLHDDGDAAGAAAFIADLIIIFRVVAARLLDGAFDIILGHGFRLGGDDRGAKARIVSGVRQPSLGGDGDFAGQLGEELGALLILAPLAEHDIFELTVTGHFSPLFGWGAWGT
jgi:hypothetical protein